jgi:ElaA protein
MDIDMPLKTSANLLRWDCKKFDALSPHELYAILQLRGEVFIVEQSCPYLDEDGKDPYCHQLMCWSEGKLIANARIVPPGISYVESSIGRVVTSLTVRKSGIGKILMRKSIEFARSLYPQASIKIGAQLYLKNFYESFAFVQTSEIYIEDGIPHIEMLLNF